MKRITAIICAAVMLAASVFAGTAFAAEKEDIAGTWYISKMVQSGIEMDASSIAAMGMNMILTLNEDGTAVMEMSGSLEEAEEGTWSFEDGIIDFGAEMTYTFEDGLLSLAQDDALIVFSREAAEAAAVSLAPAVADPKAEDFEGDWNANYYVAMGISMPLVMGGVKISVTIKDGKAFLHEEIIDLNNGGEITESKDMEFDATLEDDGTLYIDFNGEDVLDAIGMEASGVNLTMHEDGRISATSPEINEAIEALAALAAEVSASSEEDAQAAQTEESEETGESDSGSYSLEMYLILEKAE